MVLRADIYFVEHARIMEVIFSWLQRFSLATGDSVHIYYVYSSDTVYLSIHHEGFDKSTSNLALRRHVPILCTIYSAVRNVCLFKRFFNERCGIR